MTIATWIAGNGDWSDGADWSDSAPPDDLVTGGTTDVVIDTSSLTTVTIAAGESYSADSLTLGSADSILSLAGTLALANGATITAGSIAWNGGLLESSSAQNAVLDETAGTGFTGTDFGTLDDISVIGPVSVQYQADLTLVGNTTVYADASQTIPGTITLGFGMLDLIAPDSGTVTADYSVSDTVGENGGALFLGGLYVAIGGAGAVPQTLLIDPDAIFNNVTIEAANTLIGAALINEGTLLATQGNQRGLTVKVLTENFGTIEADGQNATIGNAAVIWVNETTGLITAANDAATVLLNNFANAGTILAPAGAAVQVGAATSTWINTGQIDAAGGLIVLEGDETVADIGTVTVSNGGTLVYSYGTLDNTGGTLGAATPSLQGVAFENTTILGGEVDVDALGMTVGADDVDGIPIGAGTFDGVALIGADFSGDNLALADGSAVYTDESRATLSTIILGGYGALAILGETLDQSVDLGGGTVVGDTGAAAVAFTILAGVTIAGSGAILPTFKPGNGVTPGNLVNDGVIDANTRSFGLTVDAGTLDNLGTIAVDAGTEANLETTSFSNNGVLVADGTGNIAVNGTGTGTNTAAGLIIAQATGTVFLQNDFSNDGTIIAAGTVGNDAPGIIVLGSGPGTTWTNAGQIEAAGGVVVSDGDENVTDIGSLALSDGGFLVLTNGTLDDTGGTLSATLPYLQGLQIDGGTVRGGTLDATGLGITVGARSSYNFNPNSGNGTLDGVAIIGSLTYDTAVFADGTAVYTDATASRLATIDLAGNLIILGQTLTQSVELTGGSTLAGNTGSVSSDFTILAGATIQGSGDVAALADGVSYNGGPSANLVNDGVIAADAGGITVFATSLANAGTIVALALQQVAIDAGTDFTNTGLLDATGGGDIQVNTAFTNFFGNTLTGGSYVVGANSQLDLNQIGSLDFNQVGGLQTDAATITLSGTDAVLGVVSQGALIPLSDSLTTIARGAVFALTAGAAFTTNDAITNDGTIILTDGSTLTVGGFTNNGTLEVDGTSQLVNAGVSNGGMLVLNGGTYSSLTNAVGGTVTGDGTITGPVANDGTIIVTTGILRIEGAVTGAGSFVIDPGAELELDSSDAETIAFAADDGVGGGTLRLANTALFTGTLASLTTADAIDFGGAAIAAAAVVADGDNAAMTLGLDDGGTYDVPLADTTVTGNGVAAAFDSNDGTALTLLPVPADTGQYASTIPGGAGGVDRDPKIVAFVGYGPDGTTPTPVPITQNGANFTLVLPAQNPGVTSIPFYLSAINRNQGTDVDNVSFTEIGGGDFVEMVGGLDGIGPITPGGDTTGDGEIAEGPAISVQAGGFPIYMIDSEASSSGFSADLPVETLSIYAPLNIDTTFDNPNSSFGSGSGDVHLITFDGLHYDFQDAGEFVLAKSTALGDDFQVQIRLQSNGGASSVTVTTALAVQLDADRVTFDSTRADMLWINGTPVTLAPGATDILAGGTIRELTATSFIVTANTGEVVTVNAAGDAENYPADNSVGGVLNYTVQLTDSYAAGGFVQGLLGNDDGTTANDIALPAGAVLPQPLTEADLYQDFGNSWQVTDPGSSTGIASILDYAAGQSTATFIVPGFPQSDVTLADLPASVLQGASLAVVAAGLDPTSVAGQDALLDYALTNDTSLIAGDASLPQPAGAAITPLQLAPPSGPPAEPQAYGVAAPTTSVTEPAAGAPPLPVVFTVYAIQSVTADTVLDWAAVADGPGVLTAADFGGTLPSGTATIANGGTIGSFTVDLPAGVVGTDVSDMLSVQISDTDSTPLAAPTAGVVVGNATPVAGTPAQPGFIALSSPDPLVQSGAAATLDLGAIVIDSTAPTITLAVANNAPAGANLLAGTFDLSGDGAIAVSGDDGFQGLAGGALQAGIVATADTTMLGAHSETITLTPTDSNPSGAVDALAPQTLTIMDDVMPCFAAGTGILTAHGPVAVECLRTGDVVVTAAGGKRPITWLGHRRVDCRRHARPRDVWPVRIRAQAFGAGLPQRDLRLSPDHAVLADGILIPVKYLINGTTIVQEQNDDVTYWHVELARHDVLLAEGLPCESYLDNGNRTAFDNGGVVQLHPRFAPDARCEAAWEAAGCAPMRIDGPAVRRVDARLRRRARLDGDARAPVVPKAPRGDRVTIDLAVLLDPAWYLAMHADVAATGVEAAIHYARWGRAEGRLPCPEADLLRGLGLVDHGTRAITMPDVVAAGVDPVEHFCRHGWRERRRPNAYFDTAWYLDTYDVSAGVNPLAHYVVVGERLGWQPGPHFDAAWYRRRYGLRPSVSALSHYLKHRRTQRFSPLPGFDLAAYRAEHGGALRPDRDAYAHYLVA